MAAASKAFDLSLPALGPYALATTRAGRYLALGGHRGHLALMDRLQSRVLCEVQVRESVHDVALLHSEAFFAAAQRKYVYIYDKRGIEIHCLKASACGGGFLGWGGQQGAAPGQFRGS